MAKPADNFRTFKLLVTHPEQTASPAVYVQVDWYSVPDGIPDRKVICLTADAVTSDEFDGLVDELMSELQDLKKEARKVFSKHKK